MYVPELNDVVFFNGGKGTVIAFLENQLDRMIIGWTNKNDIPNYVNDFMLDRLLIGGGGKWKCVPDLDRYVNRGVWLHTTSVLSVIKSSSLSTISLTVKVQSAGCSCLKCGEFYPWAEPNQPNGTLICYGCRTHRFYRGMM